jgi:hypothetical protein
MPVVLKIILFVNAFPALSFIIMKEPCCVDTGGSVNNVDGTAVFTLYTLSVDGVNMLVFSNAIVLLLGSKN